MALKTAPALATGNVMITKPSEKSPFASLRFAVLAEESGLPDDMLLCLPRYNDVESRQEAIDRPRRESGGVGEAKRHRDIWQRRTDIQGIGD